jgi:hypothetical protein
LAEGAGRGKQCTVQHAQVRLLRYKAMIVAAAAAAAEMKHNFTMCYYLVSENACSD